jgi:hypothetical protein
VDASGYRQIFLTIACGFMSSKVIVRQRAK